MFPLFFLEKLDEKKIILSKHMGYHTCDMCGDSYGSCVFKIKGDVKSYIFPEMLEHYITKHKYLPPQEFIDVVMS